LTIVLRSTVIDAPIDQVWAMLRDFNGHDQWHPAIAESMIENGQPSDLIGAVRDFRLADGSRIREQLLSLSDQDHSFEYCILDAPLPLMGYVARVRLHAVTDGNQTFWEWRSHFSPPRSREKELVKIVGEDIYEAGFRAVALALRGHVKRPPQFSSPVTGPVSGASNAHAIVMEQHGGPEVLQYRAVTVAKPKAHEVRIRQSFIGVNYIDVYTRTGYFNLINPPGIPGMEAVGVIESVGENISGLRLGDRIAYACGPPGAYTDLRVMKPDFLVKVPDFLSDEIVAASLLKGITTSFLLHEVFAVKPGDVVLVHAAAGGVGLLLCQWAKALGAKVIGTTSSDVKAERVKKTGCEHVINYSHENFADVVLNLTNGKGVDVVYDAVGKDTFANSLRALKPRGTLVSFGQASGDVGTYEIGKLASKSITLSRPNYEHYTDTREAVQMHAERFFDVVRTGAISVDLPRIFPLSQAASAHELIEGRQGTGAIVLRSQI
jgi:NADPH:quinone reductase